MKGERFVLVFSGSAWVDPVVMVHALGCECGSVREAERNLREWSLEHCWSREGARLRSEFEGRRIGATSVAWMDCTL